MKSKLALLTSSAAVAALTALGLLLGPVISDFSAAADEQSHSASAGDCAVHYYALDSGKEVSGAFGPAVAARDQAAIMAELHERRECGANGTYDPALTAAHYADWANATLPNGSPANLTSMKVSWTDVTAFANLLATNKTVYQKTIDELNKLEGDSTFSIQSVKAGQPSLYMMPDGKGGITIKQGRVAHDGTNVVFTTKSGVAVRYRLECGFQPNWPTGPAQVPSCTENECAPNPVCEQGMAGTWPNCYVPCPWDSTIPKDSPNCLQPKVWSQTPVNQGWNPRGTDNGVTDGQQSADQQKSGQTRGNAGSDQVKSGSGTTNDTKPSTSGGPVSGGATPGGDDRSNDVTDPGITKHDDGGTNGATCVPDPITGEGCPPK